MSDTEGMENRCYNCKKALDPDRTCISDGECEWFEEGTGESEKRMVLERLRKDIPEIAFEPERDTECDEPEISMERFARSLPEDLVNAVWAHREEIEKLLPRVK